MFQFLWNWKFATTAMIHLKFFPGRGTTASYNRLLDLKNAGFIEIRTDFSGNNPVWTLLRRGFKSIRHSLPPLREEGFRSENLSHDRLVNAAHLGEWLVRIPEGVRLFTEQQLRRFNREYYPPWVPSYRSHRPDGYWKISYHGIEKTIALEVELSRKLNCEFESSAYFYRDETQIDQVLWRLLRVAPRTKNREKKQNSWKNVCSLTI